ncbi:hypothetical protein CGCSCA5_v005784 [Colletotrichum siamense]|nr:hypothetical protein CGCSCA5_v005784 [Colletotrichum siamense]KAF4878179.1 hypothetical protein CGCSCA1_v002740 [Colletotrichum siamense]
MADPEYAHPDQVPSLEEVKRLEKMTDMLSDIQSLNPDHGKHLKLPDRVSILDGAPLPAESDKTFIREQHEYLDCVASLSPQLLALFPDGSGGDGENTVMKGADTGSYRIFASQNPRRDDNTGGAKEGGSGKSKAQEAKAKQQERQKQRREQRQKEKPAASGSSAVSAPPASGAVSVGDPSTSVATDAASGASVAPVPASGVPVVPVAPVPASGVPVVPVAPVPASGVPVVPVAPVPASVVPVVPVAPVPASGASVGSVSASGSTIASGPDPAQLAAPKYTGLQPQLSLPQINGDLVPDSADTTSIIKFAYGLLAKETWENRSNISIFQYCQDLLSLLKKFHGAAPDSDERFHWEKLLHDLVYMRMVDKIHSRVVDVFEKHSFGSICMISVQDLAAKFSSTFVGRLQQSLHSASDPMTELDLLESMPFREGGAKSPREELGDCFRKGQTQAQATLLKQIYKETYVRRGRGTAEDGDSAWEHSPLNANGDPEYVFYDEKGRSEFQKVLSDVMRAVKDSTTELRNAKTEAANYAQRTSRGTKDSAQQQETMEQYHIQSLQYVVDAAVRAYSCLAGLREEFSEILQSHYMWLYETYNPSGTHQPERGWKSRPKSGNYPFQAIYTQPGQGDKTLIDHALSSASASAFSSPHKTDPTDKGKGKSTQAGHPPRSTPLQQSGSLEDKATPDSLPMADLGISKEAHGAVDAVDSDIGGVAGDDMEYTDDFKLLENTVTELGWQVAVSDGVGVLCRHQASLNHILRASRQVAEFVLKATIQPLATQPDWTERSLMSTVIFLASFKDKNGKTLSKEEQLALVEFFDRRKRVDAEGLNLSGTNHAEGTGLCAHMLARFRDEMVNHDVDHETVDKSLLLPSRDVTDQFRKMPVPMAVNKRCCPVCYIMLEIVERESGHRFLYAGAHSDWSAVSIPRWLPKKFFNALYNQVESVLQGALQWIVQEQGLARSSESGGTRSAPEQSSGSDPDGGSARFVHRMEMRDPGAQPRPVRPQFAPVLAASASPSPAGASTQPYRGRPVKDKALRRQARVAAKAATEENPGAPQQTPQSATDESNTSTPAYIYGKPSFVDQSPTPAMPAPSSGRLESSPPQSAPVPAMPPPGLPGFNISPTKRQASQETPGGEEPPSPTKTHRGEEGRRGGRGGAAASSSRDTSEQSHQPQEP